MLTSSFFCILKSYLLQVIHEMQFECTSALHHNPQASILYSRPVRSNLQKTQFTQCSVFCLITFKQKRQRAQRYTEKKNNCFTGRCFFFADFICVRPVVSKKGDRDCHVKIERPPEKSSKIALSLASSFGPSLSKKGDDFQAVDFRYSRLLPDAERSRRMWIQMPFNKVCLFQSLHYGSGQLRKQLNLLKVYGMNHRKEKNIC